MSPPSSTTVQRGSVPAFSIDAELDRYADLTGSRSNLHPAMQAALAPFAPPAPKALTAELLRATLDYDPRTGSFTWLAKASELSRMQVGEPAGRIHAKGYVVISIAHRDYYAHRLAFLHVTGEWPQQHVDHIDGNRANNAWANLRDVSPQVNMENRRTATTAGASGLLGVHKTNGHATKPWAARIVTGGRAINLGVFDTPEEAHAAYLKAKAIYHTLALQSGERCPIPMESVNDDDWFLVNAEGQVMDHMPASTFRRMRFSAANPPKAPEGQQWLRGMVAKHRTLWRVAA